MERIDSGSEVNDALNESKKQLRRQALFYRNRLPVWMRYDKSRVITKKLLHMRCYRQCRKLLIYCSMKSEVVTDMLIQCALRDGKEVYCPRVEGSEMHFYRIQTHEAWQSGVFGIREPLANPQSLYEYSPADSLMIMPGCVFDTQKNRIGYGGGYYDRFLSSYPLRTIAIFFDCQQTRCIKTHRADRKPEMILTETRLLK